jgi:hypothetical protein
MADKCVPVTIAGGTAGWGGYVNPGDRMGLKRNEFSDCQNCWDDNGVLRKRLGQKLYDRFFVYAGSYAMASEGYRTNHAYLSQEIELSGAGYGGDEAIADGTQDIILSLYLSSDGTSTGTITVGLYTVDGSGFPGTLLKTASLSNSNTLSTTGRWVDFCLEDVVITGTNYCIRLNAATDVRWHWAGYSGAAYAPGSAAQVCAYSDNGTSWSLYDYDFLFKMWFPKSMSNMCGISEILQNNDILQAGYYVTVANGTHDAVYRANFAITAGSKIILWNATTKEHEDAIYEICSLTSTVGASHYDGTMHLFPAPAITGTYSFAVVPNSIVFCHEVYNDESYLAIFDYHSWPKRCLAPYTPTLLKQIKNFMGVKFGDSSEAFLFLNGSHVPMVWGTSGYPYTGSPGNLAFTGLANPITQAQACMWHKNYMFWGNVVINSVTYVDRIYYSGIGTAEAGYGDNRYDSKYDPITAMISVGEYAVVSTRDNTYYLYGDSYEEFQYIKHNIGGGVINQFSICTYRDEKNNLAKVFGIAWDGLFEISGTSKKYIDEKIKGKIAINGDVCFVCPDYQRGLVIFGLDGGWDEERLYLAYDPVTETWWPEEFYRDPTYMIFHNLNSVNEKRIVAGNYASMIFNYIGYKDEESDGTENTITAYFKTSPAYLNSGREFSPWRVSIIARNESAASNMTINVYNDYAEATGSPYTHSLYDAAYTANVPMRTFEHVRGRANSIELKFTHSAQVDATFAIQQIDVDVVGGQNVEQDK